VSATTTAVIPGLTRDPSLRQVRKVSWVPAFAGPVSVAASSTAFAGSLPHSRGESPRLQPYAPAAGVNFSDTPFMQ
jgi:hypothetical protein